MEELAFAFVLLVASLMAFLISTRQWTLWKRSLIWIAGAALLGGYAFVSLDANALGLIKVLLIVQKHSEVAKGLLDNLGTGNAYFGDTLNVLFVLCVVVGLAALLAFTPGEAMERNLRRMGLVVVGMIVGSTLTLGLVVLGLGGNVDRRYFVSLLNAPGCSGNERCGDVIDGDTIAMGDTSLRIAGINAYPRNEPKGQEA